MNAKEKKYTFSRIWRNAVENYGQKPFVGFVDEQMLTYSEADKIINSIIYNLKQVDIKPNDKVVILSTNMPHWGLTYLAISTMGAIVVPILPDFHPNEIKYIINNSDAKVLFISENLLHKTDKFAFDNIHTIFKIDDLSIIKSTKKEQLSIQKNGEFKNEYSVSENDLAAIIYTSGTSGNSKGVMLSHKNISSNAYAATSYYPLSPKDRLLSILPLPHTYENTLGFICPITGGASITYLRQPPTSPVLLHALKSVRPTLMFTVPMIIEKVYRAKIKPVLNKKTIRFAFKIPFIRKAISRMIGKKLVKSFGGELKFFGIGGSKLDSKVEKFLIDAKFPYGIGYGLTETSPLLSGFTPENAVVESVGTVIEGVEIKLHDIDGKTGEGEIWARGENIMQGYYKAPELTAEVLTKDKWFKTGDLGIFDKQGILYLKGRKKDVILGSSGENIYPEQIESVINNFKHVVESLVIEKKGKLVALVRFNRDELEEKFKHLKVELNAYVDTYLDDLLEELNKYSNTQLNKFSRINNFVLQPIPLERTPTKKIKRYLYL